MRSPKLAIALCYVFTDPAFAQICSPQQQLEEYAPTQRVGTVLRDRDSTIYLSIPTDFTEILPFLGKDYQLAEHEGIDFIHSNQLVSQVSVRSVADGKIVYIHRDCPQSNLFEPNRMQRDCGGYWGNHIVIQHPTGLFTRYAHLYPDSIQVQIGLKVSRGQELGKMGNSGLSDTRHLHFELGTTIRLHPCAPAQSFNYVYDPAIYLQWE